MSQEDGKGIFATSEAKWLGWALLAVVLAAAVPIGFFQAFGVLETASDKRAAAALSVVGGLVAAVTSLIGLAVRRESERRLELEHRDKEERLKLEAAMHAGELLNAHGDSQADPAAVASGLLALTRLGRADLAVALLVDLWDTKVEADPVSPDTSTERPAKRGPVSGAAAVSNETAILVVDGALESTRNAQLVAAELLCRMSKGLDICQSLHWPAVIDSKWNPHFGVRTKVLLVEALVQMATARRVDQNALQSLTVRLYAISVGDPDVHVKGCLGLLLNALVPALRRTHVRSLMQSGTEVTIECIEKAASWQHQNPDLVFYRIAQELAEGLSNWTTQCDHIDFRPGAMAAAAVSAAGTRTT
jgi:hypothetical protein